MYILVPVWFLNDDKLQWPKWVSHLNNKPMMTRLFFKGIVWRKLVEVIIDIKQQMIVSWLDSDTFNYSLIQ
jgi:hypothetical protein